MGPMEILGVTEGPDLRKLRAYYVRRELICLLFYIKQLAVRVGKINPSFIGRGSEEGSLGKRRKERNSCICQWDIIGPREDGAVDLRRSTEVGNTISGFILCLELSLGGHSSPSSP